MKIETVLLIFILLFGYDAICQGQESWLDSIFLKVICYEISVYDQELNPISNADVLINRIDTVYNCQWSRPKFVDNIFYGSFDGILFCYKAQSAGFYLKPNKINSEYVDVFEEVYSSNGVYQKDSFYFAVKKENATNETNIFHNKYSRLLKNSTWKVDKIKMDGQKLDLDSCQLAYQLIFDHTFNYAQHFGNGNEMCTMETSGFKITVGTEGGPEFDAYHNKFRGHFLHFRTGPWFVENDLLQLINPSELRRQTFRIKKLNKRALHLELIDRDYCIYLKRDTKN